MRFLERKPVVEVRKAMARAGLEDTIVQLEESARSAEEAANAIGCELGAIVKSLIFVIEQHFIMALIAGDHICIEQNLSRAFKLEGAVCRPRANEVKEITGFTIGGVSPLGLLSPLPIAIDHSLARFDTVYASAGHPHCVFAITFHDLNRVTKGEVFDHIATPRK